MHGHGSSSVHLQVLLTITFGLFDISDQVALVLLELTFIVVSIASLPQHQHAFTESNFKTIHCPPWCNWICRDDIGCWWGFDWIYSNHGSFIIGTEIELGIGITGILATVLAQTSKRHWYIGTQLHRALDRVFVSWVVRFFEKRDWDYGCGTVRCVGKKDLWTSYVTMLGIMRVRWK